LSEITKQTKSAIEYLFFCGQFQTKNSKIMKKTLLRTLFIAGILLFGSVQNVMYAQYVSAQSGNFSVGSTWVGNQAPPDYEDIVISAGHTVTLDRGTEFINYINVYNVTIEAGAILNNNGFPLYIRNTVTGTPHYINDGTHNGPGAIHVYNLSRGRVSGSGVTNCDFLIENFGLEMTATTNLTINGNIMNSPGFPSNSSGIVFYINETGGNLIVNGNMISGATIRKASLNNFTGSLTVNGNITFAGGIDVVENRATLIISGNLTLGTGTGNYCWNRNQGHMEIGGNVLGGGTCILRHANDAYIKFGGLLFPVGFGGTLQLITPTDLNTVEYNGSVAQVVKPFGATAYRNLIISNTNAVASIEAAVTANTSLVIKPGAALTVSGGSLTVGPTATFTIESDATGAGSFISNSTPDANVKRYISGHNGNSNDGWHFLSSPVAAQTISAFHTPGTGNDLYKWDEATSTWINRTAEGGGLNGSFETNFVVGAGYLIANEGSETKTFTGTINSTDVNTSSLSYIGISPYTGWHLLGNPFSSALNWNNGTWALNNVDANAQIWNESNASYTVILPNEVIPAMNGFMVHASQNNASLAIPASSRVHSNTAWYKNTLQDDKIVLTAIDHDGGTAQTSIIRFDANATDGYDSQYDSYFLPGFAPNFYSGAQNEKYALNTLPALTGGLTIPMGFQKNDSNRFSIELTENIPGQAVYLTDLKTNVTNNLAEGSYSFDAQDGDDANRFLLHFGTLGIDKPATDLNAIAWVYDKQLFLLNAGPGIVEINDMQGRMLQSYRIESSDLQSLSVNLPAGVYVIRLQVASEVKSVKIIVQ
jgi:hypothetical protein